MILLALIVTRSSAASLQAKQGLPLGNQVLGWSILGECGLLFSISLAILFSRPIPERIPKDMLILIQNKYSFFAPAAVSPPFVSQ